MVTVELAGQEEALPPFFDLNADELEAIIDVSRLLPP